MNDTIGIIGLGTMGMEIAGHLLKEGYCVKGYDISPVQTEILASKGGIAAASPEEAAVGCSAVILMVFNGSQIMSSMFGEQGAVHGMTPGSSVIICASVGAETCEELAAKLAPYGITVIDSPVRGTAASCADGTLYLMIGAEEEAFLRNRPLLETIGSTLVYVGPQPGMGQKAKTCMQAFFSLTFETTYETLALGRALGLDPAKVYEILNATGASSSIFRATAANVAKGSFTGTGNPLSILDKDMQIASMSAARYGLPVPAIDATAGNFNKAMKEFAEEDVWAAMKILENAAGIEVRFDIP